MDEDNWICPRCSAHNESWRRWCRSCPATQTEATTPAEPQAVTYTAVTPPARGDRVHPLLAVAMIAAILVAGVGAYVALRPRGDGAKPAVADTATEAPILNNDQIMAALSWTADDAPHGWSFTKDGDASKTTAGWSQPDCGASAAPATPIAHAEAPDITNDEYLALGAVDLYANAAALTDAFNAISDGSLIECIRVQVVSSLEPILRCSCTGINVTVVPMPPPRIAPSPTYAFRFTIDRDGYVGAQVDAYFIGSGRAQITMMFVSLGGPFPSDTETRLTTTMIDRLRATPTPDKTF